tara:strand:- start:106 stop:789 length:684 start_codon:yes stop_codon:yes gene_type:complete
MNNIINIGIPSKGRLKKKFLKIFKNKKLKLISERGERDLIGSVQGKKNIKILYLHAREIIQRLGDGSLDLGFSGFDLFKESEFNIQKKINVIKKYDFGKANLVIAIPDPWIDVQTVADLEEIAFEFKDKKKKRIRVATKYPNLTRNFLYSKGVTQFQLVASSGAMEVYPFTGSANLISDISSSGETIKSNNLRTLKDGIILKSQACLFLSKKNKSKVDIKKTIRLFT